MNFPPPQAFFFFNRFCSTRWVEDKHVAERAMEISKPFKKLSSIGKAYPNLNVPQKVIWMLTTPLDRSFCSCQIAVFPFCCWNFWTIFGDWPIVSFTFAELEKIFDKLHWLIFCQEPLAGPVTNKLKKKWLNNTEYHLESGLVDLGAATKALLNDVMVSAQKKSDTQLWDVHYVFLQLIWWTVLRNAPKDLWFWLTPSLL